MQPLINPKKLTLQQMQSVVNADKKMSDMYLNELSQLSIKYSKKGCKIGGKRVGINRLINAQKYAAANVYETFYNKQAN